MVNVADLMITSLDTISNFGLDGAHAFDMDELQDATISNTQEKENITGKGGRKLGSLKRNKGVTVSGTNGLLSGGLMEAQTGGTFEHKTAAPVKWCDYLVVNGNKAATEYKAVGTAGAEIIELYIRDSNGIAIAKLEQAEAAEEGKFAYDPATKEISFVADAYEDGTEIVVYYIRNVEADVLTNDTETYSKVLRTYIDATAEDRCGKVYHVQFYIPKADFSGEFDVAMGDNQTVHEFEIESLSGSCGAGGYLWTYTVFGVNAEDAA